MNEEELNKFVADFYMLKLEYEVLKSDFNKVYREIELLKQDLKEIASDLVYRLE